MNTQIVYDKKVLRKMKRNYYMSKALYEVIKAESEKIQNDILKEHEYYESDENLELRRTYDKTAKRKRITREYDTFLMEDKDFDQFLDILYERCKKAGIADERGKEWCPEANAHKLYTMAEKELVNYAISLMPWNEQIILKKAALITKHWESILDAILRLED